MPIRNITKSLLLAVLAGLLLNACSKKDIPPHLPTTVSIVGKWYYVTDSTTYYTYNPADVEDMQYVNKYDHTKYIQLNGNNTGVLGTVDLNNNTQTQTFTYSLTPDNKITFNYPEQTVNGATQAAFSYVSTVKNLSINNWILYYTSKGLNPKNVRYAIESIYLTK